MGVTTKVQKMFTGAS